VASLAEGFGLPMAEALGRGKPVLARDIPIFRMNANALVTYFPLQPTSGEFSKIIDSWLSSAVQSGTASFEEVQHGKIQPSSYFQASCKDAEHPMAHDSASGRSEN
jgi:hypothetical protein